MEFLKEHANVEDSKIIQHRVNLHRCKFQINGLDKSVSDMLKESFPNVKIFIECPNSNVPFYDSPTTQTFRVTGSAQDSKACLVQLDQIIRAIIIKPFKNTAGDKDLSKQVTKHEMVQKVHANFGVNLFYQNNDKTLINLISYGPNANA